MKISVVIPAYNEEKYIGSCLENLAKQEVPADEIIVVDNNSRDKTADIARQYGVTLITEKKKGTTNARNRGFNEAKYEIIARTDADTLVPPDWIKKIKRSFLDEKLIAVSGPSHFYEIPGHLSEKAVFNFHKPYFRILKQILHHDGLYGPNMAIRKNAWEKVKDTVCLDDSKVHEDIDLAIHIAALGKIKYDPNLTVSASFRRWKRIEPYFEYPYRMLKSVGEHKQLIAKDGQTRTDIFKKFVVKALNSVELMN